MQEAREIFGEVDELLAIRKQGLESSEWKERRLEDEFEPSILSEKYMTEKDDQIRMTDVPERMQVLTSLHWELPHISNYFLAEQCILIFFLIFFVDL